MPLSVSIRQLFSKCNLSETYKVVFIGLLLVISTYVIDTTICYIGKFEFYPGSNYSYKDVITSWGIFLALALWAFLLHVFHECKSLKLISSIIALSLCYPINLEVSLLSTPLHLAILSYTVK